jgi:hypothetical protein
MHIVVQWQKEITDLYTDASHAKLVILQERKLLEIRLLNCNIL